MPCKSEQNFEISQHDPRLRPVRGMPRLSFSYVSNAARQKSPRIVLNFESRRSDGELGFVVKAIGNVVGPSFVEKLKLVHI